MQFVIDERHGRTSATGQALDELHAKFSIRRRRRRAAIAVMFRVRVESDDSAKPLLDRVAAGHRARQRAANTYDRLAGSFPAKPWIKRDKLVNVDRLKLEPGGYPVDPAVVDVSEMVLPVVKQRQGSAALGYGVM